MPDPHDPRTESDIHSMPSGAMTDIIAVKSHVDAALLDRVEEECDEILWRQRQRYNQRWYLSAHFAKTTSVMRVAGFIVSAFGIGLSIFYLLYPSVCPKWFYGELYLVSFVAAGFLFYFLPQLQAKIVNRMLNAGRPGCRKMAQRFVSKARKRIPYEAEYAFRGDLVSLYREKDGKHQQIWSRRVSGFAILGQHVTLVFRKSTSIIPTMLLLYADKDPMESALRGLGIEYETMSFKASAN